VYVERRPFHEQLRYERQRRGWSQADLAEKARCDTKTVGRWESGERLPHPYHRQLLGEIFGKDAEELGLTALTTPPPSLPVSQTASVAPEAGENGSPSPLREDWDEAPGVISLYGREKELGQLERWLEDRRCQVIAVLGMGGMGKTALVATAATHVKKSFECIFWRSLQNAPPVEVIVKQCLRFLSQQLPADLPEDVDDLLPLLIPSLRSHRCLLVLDNAESIMQAGQHAGRYREGYAAYGKLIKLFGEIQHQSCLVLTSREKPKEVVRLEGKTTPVRTLTLAGIEHPAGQELLRDRGLFGSDEQWADLIARYSGNPLALQLVSEPVQEVFGGNIARFLQEDVSAFEDVNDLLDQHFQRLSDEEQQIMYWLAIEREVVPLEELREDLAQLMAAGTLPDILDSLRRRSMIETRSSAHFTLQPVIMEYVTGRLVERAFQEFVAETPGVWMSHALIKAKSKDYTRQSQERLLLAPLVQRLFSTIGKRAVEQRAKSLLAAQRQGDVQHPGYLAGNILNLLSYAKCSLRGFDFSHLTVRQASLLHVPLPEVNFAHAQFVETVFTSTLGNVYAVASSPQKNLLAVGTSTGDIWLYDVLRGTFLLTCHGHTDGVWGVAFSPDGRLLASGSDDQTVRLWESDTGRCLHLLQDHTNRVRSVAFSPDGKLLASGSDDATIRLWDAESGRSLNILQGHADRVWSVAFAPGGKLLASGSTDQTVRVWEIASGKCITVLQGHSNWVRSIAFHPGGGQLASASDDHTVRVWEVSSGRSLKTLHGHTNRVWSVTFSPDGQTIASGSEDQSVRLWDTESGRPLKTLHGHAQGVRCVTFLADGQMLASGGDDQTCRLWDTNTGNCLNTLQGYTNRVWCVAFEPGGALLASAGEDQQIRLWDVESGVCTRTMQDSAHGVLVVAFSPNGQTLAGGGQDQVVRLWDVSSGRCVQMLQGHTNWIRTVAFSPDGKLLASGGEDHTIRLWDIGSGQAPRVLSGHTDWVRAAAFSPDGSQLASGSDDGTVRVWDVSSGRCLHVLRGHTNRVRSIAYSPDGHMIASGSEDQTIRLWETSTGQCLNSLQGHSSRVRSLAFSPDGRQLASGSEDQSIRLWESTSGKCLNVLQGHISRVRSVAFSPDGSLLASCSDDGTIKLWSTQAGNCLKTLTGERPYEGMNITASQGLTEAQKASLRELGAVEN
jgi:WD40 repeat protein/transcriptional regulator with XRE-family HTH domain